MRFFAGVLATIILAGTLLTACKSHDEKQSGHNSSVHNTNVANANLQKYPDGVNRVTVSELKEALENGDAVVLDVRGGPSFEVGHIKGARLIPSGEISSRANELPRDKMIVTYCS
jgi:3-mercaptopyruvate sulfurtransferase SseA